MVRQKKGGLVSEIFGKKAKCCMCVCVWVFLCVGFFFFFFFFFSNVLCRTDVFDSAVLALFFILFFSLSFLYCPK